MSEDFLWIMGHPHSVTLQSAKTSCEPMDEEPAPNEGPGRATGGNVGRVALPNELAPGVANGAAHMLDAAARIIVGELRDDLQLTENERANRRVIQSWSSRTIQMWLS